jgi:hypothetical protein
MTKLGAGPLKYLSPRIQLQGDTKMRLQVFSRKVVIFKEKQTDKQADKEMG